MEYLFFSFWGYLFGSITFGYLVPKYLKNMNIRNISTDGNPGTANAFIHAGLGCGMLVLAGDLLKGAIPVFTAAKVVDIQSNYFIFIMAAPLIGHAFPLFGGFKNGGKGIAVSFGILLGLYPIMTHVFFLAFWYIFFSVVCIVKPHSYRTVAAFICWVLSEVIFIKNIIIVGGSILMAAIVIGKHRQELKRKEERQVRFLFRKS